MFKQKSLLVLIVMCAVLFSGCLFGSDTVNQLIISADASLVQQGNSVNLSVKGFDKKNKEVELTNLEWLLDNDTKGKLESDGITAVFTADQAFEGMVKIEVKFEKLSDSIEIEITAMDLGDRE